MAAVSKLNVKPVPFERAVDLFCQARLGDCYEALRGQQALQSALLRARSAVRLGRPELAADALRAFEPSEIGTNRERAELFVVSASLALAVGDLDRARVELDAARVYGFGAASVQAEAEYEFYEAALAFAFGDYDESTRACERALSVEAIRFESKGYGMPLAHTRARTLHLVSLIHSTRGEYDAQILALRAAYDELTSAARDDAFVRASLLMHVAFYVRDCDHEATRETALLEKTPTDTWPDELSAMAFEIHRGLAWNAALRGDHLRAFRAFRRTAEHAKIPSRKVLVSVDRAFLARELGEAHSAREEVEYAIVTAESIDWAAVGEERIALARLAQEAASFAPAVARSLFERYRTIRTRLNPLTLNAVDRRARAYELMAEGTISKANGEVDIARNRFVEAFDIWSACGYRWRAATAALELADSEPFFASFARAEAALRPGSWLARRVAALDGVIVASANAR